MAEFMTEYGSIILLALRDTLIMVVLSTGFGYLLGIPLGVVAYVTDHGSISENAAINTVVGWLINIIRSIPFIILILFLIPYTRLIMGTASGTRGVIFPLVVGSAPFIARMVESSFNELDRGVIESAQVMGATNFQIIWKVLLPESFPSLLRGMSIATITIIGYIAMAGMVGGGGPGAVAINGPVRTSGDDRHRDSHHPAGAAYPGRL